MVTIKQNFTHLEDGTVDLDTWVTHIQSTFSIKENLDLIKDAAELAQHINKGLTTFYGQPCIEQGLTMAEILIELQLDQEAIAAAIMTSVAKHTKIADETITKKLGPTITKLIHSVDQMNVITTHYKNRNETQINRLRKTILAMASDIRVVLIKLAEKTCILRGIKNINPMERKRIAQETLDVYAPLANRLGIGQLKWELEDLSFHYIDTEKYKTIAKYLAERRIDRQERINKVIQRLKEELCQANIACEITGRAKHIYSIFLKMQKKQLDYKNIYDTSAVRILVPTIDDCYKTLSIVNHLWEHLPEEFDDYIANPKPNGYQSIHTAVIGPENKNLEIQIRTHAMHDKAEHGVAAHWIYKEAIQKQSSYENKISFLRQLLSWQKDIANQNQQQEKTINALFDDNVYVFTPAGDIIDLAKGSTPLDFAYHIHSELGHRCRGAKINGHIIPLTYQLKTGETIEIITTPNGIPSRDWLSKDAGYLKTSRAKAKVLQWFKQQDVAHYIESGKHILEREMTRTGLVNVDIQKIASRLRFKNTDALYATLAHGNIRAAQIMQAALNEQHTIAPNKIQTPIPHTSISVENKSEFQVSGINDLLTRIAKCCKPIPNDEIIGYITQGRGVSIHRHNCRNITSISDDHQNRLISVNWDHKNLKSFYVDLQIHANNEPQILKEITTILANAKTNLISMNSTHLKKDTLLSINLTIEIQNTEQLNKLMLDLKKSPGIAHITRAHQR